MTVPSLTRNTQGAAFKNIFLFLSVLAAIFLSFEGTLRVAGFHPVNRSFQPVIYSPELGWELKKNHKDVCEDLEWRFFYQTNSRGFRDTEHSFEKKTGNPRVLVLGDSLAEGYGVREEDRWTFLLEKKFENHPEIINLGVRGYDILQEYKLFLKTGLSYHPDWMIQVLNESDYGQTAASSTMDVSRRFRPSYRLEENELKLLDDAKIDYPVLKSMPGHVKALLYRSVAVVWFRRCLERLTQGRSFWAEWGQQTGLRTIAPADAVVTQYQTNYPQAVERVYRNLAELAASHSFRMLVVWVGEHEAPEGLREKVLRSGNAEWMEILLPQSSRFRYDPHPNIQGNHLIAARIFEKLKRL